MNYILYGKQYPMIKKRLNKMLKDRLGEVDDFNVSSFDYENDNIDDALDEATMLPLGYDRKAVIIDNVSFLGKSCPKDLQNKILDLVSTNNDSIDVYFVVRSETIDDKSPIVEAIKNNGQILNFMDLKKEDWPRYALKYFTERNVTISEDAINELIVRIDGDLNRFINEADKLCLYKDNINLIDVTLMVAKPIEDDVYQMCNALLRSDNMSALAIYRDLRLLGSRSTDGLIPLLANQFRFISQVFYLYDKGLDRFDIAKELNCNQYRVKIALDHHRYLNREYITHALDDLYYLDLNIKSGLVDRFYGFELFLINFPN